MNWQTALDWARDVCGSVSAVPITSAVGAEVSGVNLGDLSADEFQVVDGLLSEFGMLIFRDQFLDHHAHLRLSEMFGGFAQDAYTGGLSDFPDMQPIIRERNYTGRAFGEGWHRDSPFLDVPPSITILRAVEVPPWGSDTLYASTAAPLLSLSDQFREFLIGKQGLYTNTHVLRARDLESKYPAFPHDLTALESDLHGAVVHDLIQVHPVSGRSSIYCDPCYTVGIAGMKRREAVPILGFLSKLMIEPRYSCRVRWTEGAVVLWDNLLVLHHAFNDSPPDSRREMYRTTVMRESTMSPGDNAVGETAPRSDGFVAHDEATHPLPMGAARDEVQ